MNRALDERSYDGPLSQDSAAELALIHHRRDPMEARRRAGELRIVTIIWFGLAATLIAWLLLR